MKTHFKEIFICAGIILSSVGTVNSQISPFADAEGETSLQIVNYNAIILNAKESSFGLSYGPESYPESAIINWSINLKTKAKKGVSSIIKAEEFSLDGEISVPFSFPLNQIRDKYFYVIPTLTFGRANIFDPKAEISKQVNSEGETGYSLALGYNNENANSFIFGVSLKGGVSNNSSLISALNVQTIKFSVSDSTSMVIASTEKSAFNIDEYNSSHSFLRLNFDIGNHVYSNRVLCLLQGRYKADENLNSIFNVGLGLYLTKDNAPFEVHGGIQLSFTDLFQSRTEDSFAKRTVLNFVAAIPL